MSEVAVCFGSPVKIMMIVNLKLTFDHLKTFEMKIGVASRACNTARGMNCP